MRDATPFQRALTGCPDNKIKDAVEALSPPQQSLLMQYAICHSHNEYM
jgi:hypothetical protein